MEFDSIYLTFQKHIGQFANNTFDWSKEQNVIQRMIRFCSSFIDKSNLSKIIFLNTNIYLKFIDKPLFSCYIRNALTNLNSPNYGATLQFHSVLLKSFIDSAVLPQLIHLKRIQSKNI